MKELKLERSKCAFDLDKIIPIGVSKIEYYASLVKKIIKVIKENFENIDNLEIYIESSVLPIFQMNNNLFKSEFKIRTEEPYKVGELKLDEETYVNVHVPLFIFEKGKLIIFNEKKTIYGYIRNKEQEGEK